MANYPTADPSFTTKSAGETIQPSHVNGLQDEVVAIGSALRGTLQHSVTLAAGNNLTVGGSITSSRVSYSTPTCRLAIGAAFELANDAFVGLAWDTESEDSHGMHSTASNSSRITFADSTGLYAVGAALEFAASTAGSRMVRLVLNGAQGIASHVTTQESIVPGAPIPVAITTLLRVGSTADYVTVQAYQNSGSTLSVQNSTLHATNFWAYKVAL